MSKKKHHYVPQFYLKLFSNNEKSVGMFTNKSKHYIADASIKTQAYEDYLYGKTDEIENELMRIEGEVATTIKNILKTKSFPKKDSEEYYTFLLFLTLSEARVSRAGESSNSQLKKFIAETLTISPNCEYTKDELDKANFEYTVPNLLPMKVAAKTYLMLLDLKPVLIKSNCDRQFITSDNPIIRYNYFYVVRNYQLRGYGLGTRGFQVILPISPKYAIMLYDSKVYDVNNLNQGIIHLSKGKNIDELNRLIYLNSYLYIFFQQ